MNLTETKIEFSTGLAAPVSRARLLVRTILFLWTVLVACPIRYWPLDATIDNTWVFALNYAAAHGLAYGRDVLWASGPLGYLVYPLDIGGNIAQALVFQFAVWAVLIVILADVFYVAGLRPRNLAYFSVFFSLSAPLYWFNYMGVENLLLAGTLILLLTARFHGGLARYVTALALTGAIPLIKLTGGMLALGAVVGYLVDRWIRHRRPPWIPAVLAVLIPVATAGIGCWLLLPSWDAFVKYLRGSLDIIGGYSAAMSSAGDPVEFAGAAESMVCIGAFLFWKARSSRQAAWFFVALLTVPLLMSLKHGFVRQDIHVINFFFFVGLALGLVSLVMPLEGARSMVAFLVVLNFGLVALEYMFAKVGMADAFAEASGFRGASLAVGALHPARMRADFASAARDYLPEARIEPEMRSTIGSEPVASLSLAYSGALLDGLNLAIYPVVQRYAAYTPYLDAMNAAWVRDKGPRFLVFDGHTIDQRHPWAETPAMWLEVFRWYDTRLTGTRSVLLMRRPVPRFEHLKSVARFEMPIGAPLDMPLNAQFWSLNCAPSMLGRLEKLALRVPELRVRVDPFEGQPKSFRILAEVLANPVLGRYLPESVAEFGAVFSPVSDPKPLVKRITMEGSGLSSYGSVCKVETFEPN